MKILKTVEKKREMKQAWWINKNKNIDNDTRND